jgi:hypothetical protein
MADWFLVVTKPMEQLTAMIFFSVTQICYFLRLYISEDNAKKRALHCIIRASLVAIALALTFIVLKDKTDALSLVSLFYYANLIMNIIAAFAQFKKFPILAIGLLLFLMCDTFIGLDVMAKSYIPIQDGSFLHSVLHSGLNIGWIFYVPSQALIAISLLKIKRI